MARLSDDRKYVTVENGDTLSHIAIEFRKYSGNASWQQLAAINELKNPHLLSIGQKIYLTRQAYEESKGGGGTTPKPQPKPVTPTQATITNFGLQSDSDGTLFATWSWSRSYTESYDIEWTYDTGNSVWFIGNKSNTTDKQSTYSIPSNAKRVRFRVKPIAQLYDTPSGQSRRWSASWSTEKIYDTSNLPPKTPSTPSVEIDNFKLTATIDNINASELNATGIQFQIVKNDNSIFKTGNATINTSLNYVSYSCTVSAGAEYKVRCRSYRGNVYSEWSSYSSNVETIPSTPSSITTCKANSETSVYLKWGSVNGATSYDIEYATKKEYFDRTDSTTTKSGIKLNYFEVTGLESGQEYFFRVRAVNNKGSSGWTSIKSTVIGKEPSAPTTWSSTTTVVTGEKLTLYWVHNSEDNSSQTFAELELVINGKKTVKTIKNSTDEDLKDLTSHYDLDTKPYVEGTEIKWRVRTAGITKVYGEWSIERVVTVHAPATLEMKVTDSTNSLFEVLEAFPIKVNATAGPSTQTPTGYSLSVIANNAYETIDEVGNNKVVNAGDEVYSRFFDISTPLSVTLSAGDIDLVNNIEYTVTCVVSMNSGLTASDSMIFTVAWHDEQHMVNAEINYDPESLVTHIHPYCVDVYINNYLVEKTNEGYILTSTEIEGGVYGSELEGETTTTGEQLFFGIDSDGNVIYYCEITNSVRVENVTLSVYRREFDGSFVELGTGISNDSNTFITDPHPALDYARYRIVAIANDTGAVSYYDMPGYPTGEVAAIIQWEEDWSNFDVTGEDLLAEPTWSGSLLRLPYNIDISDGNKQDVELVEYIGRKHPVSYYGTQLGHKSTWNMDVPADDKETIYALRRLQNWMGDVYVREPSGSGYWANISVSFSKTHCELTIPVTMNITRVEGGI